MNIEQYIEDQLQNVDIKSIVVNEVKNQVGKEIFAAIKRLTEQEITTIIKKEIEIALTQPVSTDDGWGKKEKFDSFDTMFRKVFAEKLNNSYEIKGTIKKMVEEKVSKLYEQNKKEAIERVVSSITSKV